LLPTLTLPGRHAVEEHLADLLDSCLKVNALQRPPMQTVQNALVEAALKFPDLAHCVTVVRPPVAARTDEQMNEGMEVLPALASHNFASGLEPVCDRLVRQGLLPTPAQAMCASMMMTVQRWNFPLPRVACCPFHASLKTLGDTAEVLTRMECDHDFFPPGLGQCHRCGLLFDLDASGCDICGSASSSSLTPIQEKGESVVS